MGKKLDALGVSAFCESMAMMLGAGIQTEEALGLLEKKDEDGALAQALQQMAAAVAQGSDLGEAMEQSGAFPVYAVRMAAAGEHTGRLENVLERLAGYYAEQKRIAQKLRNAITYPMMMLCLTIAVLAVMLLVVLPAFTGVYDTLAGSLTATSYGYIRWAYGFCWAALAIMVLAAVVLAAGLLLWNGGKRDAVRGVLQKLPLCGDILQALAMFRFTAALATFLASGELQDNAVRSSLDMAEDKATEARLQKCLAHMEEGHGFAQAAYEENLFEPVYGRMLLAGERSGSLETVLDRLTTLLENSYSAMVDRLVAVVDPTLSGVLMFTVGASLISVMLPLLGMMNAIG